MANWIDWWLIYVFLHDMCVKHFQWSLRYPHRSATRSLLNSLLVWRGMLFEEIILYLNMSCIGLHAMDRLPKNIFGLDKLSWIWGDANSASNMGESPGISCDCSAIFNLFWLSTSHSQAATWLFFVARNALRAVASSKPILTINWTISGNGGTSRLQ